MLLNVNVECHIQIIVIQDTQCQYAVKTPVYEFRLHSDYYNTRHLLESAAAKHL
jgi:hypothetical protein